MNINIHERYQLHSLEGLLEGVTMVIRVIRDIRVTLFIGQQLFEISTQLSPSDTYTRVII